MKFFQVPLSRLLLAILASSAAAQEVARLRPTFASEPGIQVPAPKPATVFPELALAAAGKDLAATIAGPTEFFGGLLLSPSPTLRHFLLDLPPMLDDGVLVATGKAVDGRLEFVIPGLGRLPFAVHGQALVLHAGRITASEVVTLTPTK